MFNINQYFEGKVASIAFRQPEGPATLGVMAPGEYEFGTGSTEIMHVITGNLTVKLPQRRRQSSAQARASSSRPTAASICGWSRTQPIYVNIAKR